MNDEELLRFEQSIFLSTKLRLNLSHIFNQRQVFFAHAWLGSVTLNFRTEPCIKGVNGAKMFPWRGKFSAKASETFFTAICLFHHSLRTGQSLARCQLSKSNASHFSKIYPSSHANIIQKSKIKFSQCSMHIMPAGPV